MMSMKSWIGSLASVVLLYLTGPATNLWFLALVALVPVLLIARFQLPQWKLPVYLSFFGYYFLALEGLRHAHPLMIFPLLALAAYLAVYPLLFVGMLRRWLQWVESPGSSRWKRIVGWFPIALLAASLWVGGEWVRNYFATGISVLMLGHSLADMPAPTLIQIADLCGTYAVSFLLVVVNVAIADGVRTRFPAEESEAAPEIERRAVRCSQSWQTSVPIALLAVLLTHLYGLGALEYPIPDSNTTFLIVGRDEQTEYQQDHQRAMEIFSAYARQTIAAVRRHEEPIDAVIWPESMLSGGQAWYIAEDQLTVPPEMDSGGSASRLTTQQMRQIIVQSQADFTRRSADLMAAMSGGDALRSASIIGGCSIIRYGLNARQFSGVLHVGPDGRVRETYAKNHLVMFGEYIPWIRSIPVLNNYVPAGLGLDAGTEPAVFQIGSLGMLPNLCIETAVERVSVNHMRSLLGRDADSLPDVIVTLTNDAWFDRSSVVAHHLRCAQMVAIGCRRPILSSANGGPTAWIDSDGRVVEKLPFGQTGEILARPKIDDRVSLYVRYGSWPAAMMGIAWTAILLSMLWQKRPFFRRGDRSGSTSLGRDRHREADSEW